MKNLMVLICSVLIGGFAISQSASNLYRKGDSLYRAKSYESAAKAYLEGIRMEGMTDAPWRYSNAANAWVLAGRPDSAFKLLELFAQSNRISLSMARNIKNSRDLAALKADPRWQPLMDKIFSKATSNFPQEEMIYGRKDGIALTMIQLLPKGKPNGKAIIRVVAGSWYSSYRMAEDYTSSSFMYLERGYKVFLVVVASQPRYAIPDEIADLKRAVRYIRYNANKFGIDPANMGIEGSSAGGHLALTIATADDNIDTRSNDSIDMVSSRVKAIAVLFPPTDFLNWGFIGNIVNAYDLQKVNKVSGALDFRVWNSTFNTYDPVADTSERNKIGKEISPFYAVSPDDPPVFIIHGDADNVVPLQQSQAIIERFKEAGVPNRFVIKKGGRHNAGDMSPEWLEFVDWFDKYLK